MSEKKVLTVWSEDEINREESRILRTACSDVPFPLTSEVEKDIDALVQCFLGREEALGLAAPQIGISKKIVVFRNKALTDNTAWTKSEADYDVLINPRITQGRGELVYMSEGCLSCPEIKVEVGRFPEIKVRAADRKGRKINIRYADFLARIVQHEIDHLKGTLIIDYEGTVSYPKKRSLFFEKLLKQQY